QPATCDRAQADHARTEDDARGSRLDLRGVDRGAEPRRQPACEETRAVEWSIVAHLGERDLGHDGVLGERGSSHEMADRLAVARQPGRAVGQVALVLLVADREAEIRARVAAVDALAALGREERDDVVAGREGRDAVADAFDDACALVAEHRRRVTGGIRAGSGVQVGVADAARDEPDEHFAGVRLREIELLHRERGAEVVENRGSDLHRRIVSRARFAIREDPPVIRTAFTEMLGIEHPVVSAGMGAGMADGDLAGAVSHAGGLGVVGASWLRPEQVAEMVARAREITDRPIAVNLLLFGNEHLLDDVLRTRPAVLSTAWAADDQDLAAIFASAHEAGAKVMHMVPRLDDAERAVEAGADVVVAQGTDGGGHVGLVGTTVVVRQVAKAVSPVPVLAAGGLADGAGLAAALALGASGILLGTRFLATNEAPLDA